MLRTYLPRLEPEEHVLLLTLHHIITDGWSNRVLAHELSTLYQACEAGQPSPLAPLPLQYADYALWQREWLQGEVLEAQLAYWKKQLVDVPHFNLPTDHPRPVVQTHRGASQLLQLPAALSEDLMALSRREHVTLFMLLAAFQVLLLRYSGQSDICVGTPIANRRYAEIEGVIGFFVNALALRTDLSGNPTFLHVLQQVREVCLGAYAHQDIPFEKIVERLVPERDLSRSPLFQVLFVLQDASQKQGDPAGHATARLVPLVRHLDVEHTISKIDLTLSVAETGQGLRCAFQYNTDLFEAETIRRMQGHWQTLLQEVVQAPQARVWELPLLTDGESSHLLGAWKTTQADSPQELCAHQLFEQQVERTPDAVALVFEDEVLTYSQLNQRANRLAHYLQKRGVGLEVLVGICVERSVEMIIGLLAVLKAGGGYVPLDPTYPQERLSFMAQDAQLAVLLTQQRLKWQMSVSHARMIVLDDIWTDLQVHPASPPASSVSVENLAYVIYTSGSTGEPKGVQVTHRGLGNLGQAQSNTFGVGPESRVLQFASLSFDASVSDILMALLTGASLHLERTEQLLPGPALR